MDFKYITLYFRMQMLEVKWSVVLWKVEFQYGLQPSYPTGAYRSYMTPLLCVGMTCDCKWLSLVTVLY